MVKKLVTSFSIINFFILLLCLNALAENSWIVDFKYDRETKEVGIISNKQVIPEYTEYNNPDRVVLDFMDTVFAEVKKEEIINDENIKDIKISQFESNPAITRMTINLNKKVDFEIRLENEGNKSLLKLATIESYEDFEEDSNGFSIVEENQDNVLESFVVAKNKLIISSNNEIKHSLNFDKDNQEYNLILENLLINDISELPQISFDGLKSARIKHIDGNTIIKLKNDADFSLFTQINNNNNLIVYSKSKYNNDSEIYFEELKLADKPNFSIKEVDFGKNSKLLISTEESFDYDTFILSKPYRLVIDTYDTEIGDLDKLEVNFSSKNIKRVRYGDLKKVKNKKGVRIVIDLKKRVIFNDKKNLNGLEISLLDFYSSSLANKTIVIDAGHGGNDVGSEGSGLINEKTVTLAIAKKLQKLLEDQGAKVIMTRRIDKAVVLPKWLKVSRRSSAIKELQGRVDIANNNNADALISIHCNAFKRSSVRGIETYYTNFNSLRLARHLHGSMIKNLNAKDRRIRRASMYLTKHSKSPSVLIETGFLTNPIEGKLLASSRYQKKLAESISKGLKTYFKNTTNKSSNI